ncbi:hypothetical protein FA15DRAFT_662039 [Coprinopsis marcescibilis]|uniref:Uncharacterized protein n=1 Tax=Coprinopsis marcescibilis TaxID=230819 RepID=A0A5C3K953_COPMA|nr:hypothetical protein FA15DRAFT_662039 [Coprinopsis marcescibilis]
MTEIGGPATSPHERHVPEDLHTHNEGPPGRALGIKSLLKPVNSAAKTVSSSHYWLVDVPVEDQLCLCANPQIPRDFGGCLIQHCGVTEEQAGTAVVLALGSCAAASVEPTGTVGPPRTFESIAGAVTGTPQASGSDVPIATNSPASATDLLKRGSSCDVRALDLLWARVRPLAAGTDQRKRSGFGGEGIRLRCSG